MCVRITADILTKMISHSAVICFVILTILSIIVDVSSWSYPDRSKNQPFPYWGGVCEDGDHQSPIDLSNRDAVRGAYDTLRIKNYHKVQEDGTLQNTGHSLQLDNLNWDMEISGGPLLSSYIIENIHIHWDSEHTINNTRFPLEVHFVHRNSLYQTIDEAVEHQDGLCVLAVLFHTSPEPNQGIEIILDNMGDAKEHENIREDFEFKDPFIPKELFPHPSKYWTYSGSLTTPTCDEAVIWIVLQETYPVTLDQVHQFSEVESSVGDFLESNYRDIQKRNSRVLFTGKEFSFDSSVSPSAPISWISAILGLVAVRILH